MSQPIIFSATRSLWNIPEKQSTNLRWIVMRIVLFVPMIFCALWESIKAPFQLFFAKKHILPPESFSKGKIVLFATLGIVSLVSSVIAYAYLRKDPFSQMTEGSSSGFTIRLKEMVFTFPSSKEMEAFVKKYSGSFLPQISMNSTEGTKPNL